MTSRIIHKKVLLEALSENPHAFSAHLSSLSNDVGISIDSRTLQCGEVFLAIRGDLNDGHNYIGDVIKKGASLVIADQARKNDFASYSQIIFVNDTLRFFGELASRHLHSKNIMKIGVTGSNGKTTTKEMLKAALVHLVGEHAVYASVGNKNNLFGLPLCALEVSDDHRYAIFEMGMNQVHEIERLVTIVKPEIAIITNISDAHAGNFTDGIFGVRREKAQIYRGKDLTHAIINSDDEHCLYASRDLTISKVTFGRDKTADLCLINTSEFNLESGLESAIIKHNHQEFMVSIPLPGAHHAINATAALAVVKALDLSPKDAAAGIKNMAKIDGRMSIIKNEAGVLIVNDGYNANPTSMKAGIFAIAELPSERRIAAIGAMGELGDESLRHHFSLGELLASRFDYIFVCGEAAEAAVTGAEKFGMPKDKIVFKKSSRELIAPLKALLRPGDLLFIKGSLSSQMQVLASALA